MESPTDLNKKLELAVEMKSPCCAEKVKKTLGGMKGVTSFDIDYKHQRVIIEGQFIAESVKNAIEGETGLSTVIFGQGSVQHNLGAGVAAIKFGNQGIMGLLRFIQKSPELCQFEGTVDNLPQTETPLYMTVQESGDISGGLDSTGSLLTNQKGFNGFISRLLPDQNKQAEFQTTSKEVELSEMIGRCVCVHQGTEEEVKQNKSQRLACGIIARASGLFQNTKRFCACDGVTIWEQKKTDRERGLMS